MKKLLLDLYNGKEFIEAGQESRDFKYLIEQGYCTGLMSNEVSPHYPDLAYYEIEILPKGIAYLQENNRG